MANIITFYSYKGGVGRSMALANMACLIAQSGRRVLMIDWDLEAPGLHKYFYPYLANDHHNKLGLIDFYIRASNELDSIPYGAENESSINTFLSNLPDYTQDIVLSNTMRLSFIQAGSLSASYAKNVDEFDWERFFKKIPSFFSYFADYISSQYDYVLIDSRTGYTDMGGICTVLLPTKLVLVFSPNQQNLDSVFEVGKKAMEYRRRWGSNSLSIYPLPSRIEMQEQQLRIEWEAIYKRKFEDFYSELYQ
ncbi:MAG TPA: AAA family ATPase, partial [Candidatus Kapabacteria bacterium]|nr:AAA family ATPase [Candidatus Kapabacteria bacterium]